MRPIARLLPLLYLCPTLWCAGLEVVRPIIAQSDGGIPVPAGYQHVAGETLFFSCRIAGYAKTTEEKVHVTYSLQAFDPKGAPLTEIYKNEMITDVAPQDKEWMPKIATEIQIPPLVGAGTYKVLVKIEDLVNNTKAEVGVPFEVRSKIVEPKIATEIQIPPLVGAGTYKVLVKIEDLVNNTKAEVGVPFEVRSKIVEPSDTLVVRNFQFFRAEEDPQPLQKAVYRGGNVLWARFDIIGFKYGDKNRIDVSYIASVLGSGGKVLWTQPEPAAEQSDSFYPKRYVAASMSITLATNTTPADYTIAVTVTDAVGKQTYETKQAFTVE